MSEPHELLGLTSGKGREWWEGLPGGAASELGLKMSARLPYVDIGRSIFKMERRM